MAESVLGDTLQGVKVLDLSQFESAPVMTQALAWYGAEVVKIEEPVKGDQSRYAASDMPGVETFHFLLLNSNKLSATLNLRDERGKEMLRQMIPKADIFVENFAPGTIERLGFSYEQVSAINPRIIYVQVKGYGTGSPYFRLLAFDMTVQAMGGAMSITGTPETPPMRSGPTFGDTGAGMHCLSGILAALYQRHFTGRGQRIDVAMQECVVNFCRLAYAHQYLLGGAVPRTGNRDWLGKMVPADAYPCTPFGPNDYCYIECDSEEHWERLLRAMDRQDLLGDPRFATVETRLAHLDEVDRVIGEWTRNYPKDEVFRILGESGVPAGAVLDTRELADDPELRRRRSFVTIKHPTRGELVIPGWPVKLSRSAAEVVRSPLLGEHNARVYREWLGLDEVQLAHLRAENVV
ncbi:MAG: CoA transferase [Candidatus Latescibacterota bacterium]